MRKKIVLYILILIFAFVAAFAGIQIVRHYLESKASTDLYTELDEYAEIPEISVASDEDDTDSSESEDTQASNNDPTIDFDALLSINPDCVGWIYIPETEISYPIVQSSDNNHYLKYLFNGQRNSNGSIFLDCRVNPSLSDRHSIIYGHHMKNGTMFSGLTKYKDQEYFESHPIGMLITPDAVYQIDFFSGYVAGVKENAWDVGFRSDEEFETWIKETKRLSWIDSRLSPAVTDKVLTLSTCSYEFDNARFVLHGIIKELND